MHVGQRVPNIMAYDTVLQAGPIESKANGGLLLIHEIDWFYTLLNP